MLASILSNLVSSATNKPAHPFAHRFTNGLRITVVYYQQTNQFSLVLARDKVTPSLTEWQTVLKNWPYAVNAKPNPGNMDGRHYLTAILPLHPKLF